VGEPLTDPPIAARIVVHPNVYIAPIFTKHFRRHFSMQTPVKVNPELDLAIRELKALAREHEAPIWRAVARRLEGPRRNWPEVNLSKVARHAAKGSSVAVPGILLSSGTLGFPVTVGAFRASEAARKHPKGTDVRILG